jgi:hypothetical protein
MNDTCNYGELCFCDSYCAGAHFVEDECQGTSFSKEGVE